MTLQTAILAKVIRDFREAVIYITGTGPSARMSDFERAQLVATITIAKDYARQLPLDEQREFLTACGMPEAQL